MTDRPIIFSGPMVRAILDGRKSQTRRVLKPQPSEGWSPYSYGEVHRVVEGRPDIDDVIGWGPSNEEGDEAWPLPYAIGDRLWVKEKCHTYHWDKPRAVYRADSDGPVRVRTQIESYEVGRWTPATHMPRWASRLTLIVTDVRVERVADISEEDARAEGLIMEPAGGALFWAGGPGMPRTPCAAVAFRDLWDSLNAKRGYGWDVNPWVCAVTFRTIKANIDKLEIANAAE